MTIKQNAKPVKLTMLDGLVYLIVLRLSIMC